jgi:CNT family concentrative nucleoside transporter
MDDSIAVVRAIFGLCVLVLLCFGFSERRDRIRWSLVGYGVALQIVMAILILRVPFFHEATRSVSWFFNKLVGFSNGSATFVFGRLASDETGAFGFAFTVLPTIIFFSALSAILYYLRILPFIVFGFAWLLKRSLKLSGAESLAAAANVFIGQTEAPLVIKPYLKSMNRSEIMALMTGGMATIAGGVLAVYMSVLGGGSDTDAIAFGQHLLTASLLSAPAAMVVSKILVPQVESLDASLDFPSDNISGGLLDAATRGTSDGIKLALNVGGMLLAFTALVYLLNWMVSSGVGEWSGLNSWVASITDGRFEAFNFSFLVGVASAPFAWLIGVAWEDCLIVGQLLGERLVLNEFISYLNLAEFQGAGVFKDAKSVVIATYALCGFANLTSVGIQIGGISALEPSQRPNLLKFGLRSLFGGMVACYMTAIIASTLIG